MHLRYVLALSLLLVAAVACTRDVEPTPDVETPAPSPQPTVRQSPLSPPATPSPAQPEPDDSPLPTPETSPLATPADPTLEAVAVARERLADELDVPAQEVQPVLAQPVEWSDASLGCPEPGKAYAQVITPGYRIVVRVGEREYELHTDRSARNVVICDRRQEQGAGPAVEHLASELGISADEVQVVSVRRAEWPDTGLGCPDPQRTYAQVVTPGYSVILRTGGREYEVHTDLEGRIAVICEPAP